MLAISRQNLIKELLQENKSVTIADLAVRMNVTRETIRRDLRAMEQEHELIRTHGGAYILDGVQNDLDISTRQVLKTEEKKTIALKCDALIQTGEIIYLDNSTTAWFICQQNRQQKTDCCYKFAGNRQHSILLTDNKSFPDRRRIFSTHKKF